MKSENLTDQNSYQIWGWVLFVFSAIFFIASSIRAGDILGFIGGLLFLIACIVFLLPLLSSARSVENSDSEP